MSESENKGSRSGAPSRLWLIKLIALGLSSLVALVFVEVAIRLVSPQPVSWYPIYQEHPRLPMYSLMPNVKHHVLTGETDWTIETDANGYRFSGAPDPAPRCRALWLGDSFLFGHGVDYGLSVIGRVDAATPGMHHFNTGVPGYGPVQYRQVLEDALAQGLPFDRIYLMSFLGNDFHDTQWEKDVVVKDGILGNRGGLDSFLKRNLHLRRLLANVYHRLAPQENVTFDKIANDLATPAVWDEPFLKKSASIYEKEMHRILEIAREHRLPIHGIVIPTLSSVAAFNADQPTASAESESIRAEATAAGRDLTLPVEKATAIFDRVGMTYLDAAPILSQQPMEKVFFRFDGHLSELGNELVADAFMAAAGSGCGPR
ncbi:MAG: hypothetical protein AB8G23_15455 [Myxococcota bacterium]